MTDRSPAAADAADARRAERAALMLLFVGAAALGFTPIFVRLSKIGPVATALWRVVFANSILAVWLAAETRRRGRAARRPRGLREWGWLALAGACYAANLAAWHWSIKLTSVANATLFANFAPVFVTPAAYLLLGERIRPTFIAGLALAMAGAALLIGQSFTLSAAHLAGDALGLVTSALYAVYMLVMTRLRTMFSTATVMTWSAAVAAIVLLPVALASGEILIAPTLYGWAVLMALALVSHVGGQSVVAYALAHLPASLSSMVLLLQPAIAAILAWALLSEPLGAVQAAGGVVVLAGIATARRASGA